MNLNRRIITAMVCVLSLFFILITHLVIFTVNPPDEFVKEVETRKSEQKEKLRKQVIRGNIYDRDEVLIAGTKEVQVEVEVPGEENETAIETEQLRVYPYGTLYSHVVGYSRTNVRNGRTNIEMRFDDQLATPRREDKYAEKNSDGKKAEGANLYLTVDTDMTKQAQSLLRGNTGSVIVMNPKTGEIYCMYSNPTFNPDSEYIGTNWNKLNSDPKKPFTSRATQSIKEPGSTFKIVTAIAALENGQGDYVTEDTGSTVIDGRPYTNSTSYTGKVDLIKAIEVSSNVYFAELSQKIGSEAFQKTAEKFYMCKGQKIKLDIPVTDPGIDFDAMSATGLAEAAFGQGTVNVTPLHMAMVASAVANRGQLMKPYLVQKMAFSDGEVLSETVPEILSENVMSEETAKTITEGMVRCVSGKNGTGGKAAVRGITVAGKTGTAENPSGADHTWFIGFAPANNPQVAVCVMRENSGGSGGGMCGTIAGAMISYCRNNGYIVNSEKNDD